MNKHPMMMTLKYGTILLILGIILCINTTVEANDIEQVHIFFTGNTMKYSVMWVDTDKLEEGEGEKKNNGYKIVIDTKNGQEEVAEGKKKFYKGSIGEDANRKPVNVHNYEAIFEAKEEYFEIYPSKSKVRKYLKFKIDPLDKAYYIPSPKNTIQEKKDFSFLSYGDMDINDAAQCTMESIHRTIKHGDTSNLQFVLHQGDLGYAYWADENRWRTWFEQVSRVAQEYPYMVTPGNHEDDQNFTAYKNRFSLITGEESKSQSNLYYSWNFANIHFIALSTEHEDNDIQRKWLENDLKQINTKAQPFTIAYLHRPMYSSNDNHGNHEPSRRYFEDLFVKYRVDLVLNGHVHAYERTCPMNNHACVDHGPVHVVAGTAGYNLNKEWKEEKPPSWSLKRLSRNGYLQLYMNQKTNTLTIEFLENVKKNDNQCVPSSVDQFSIRPHPDKFNINSRVTKKESHTTSTKDQLKTFSLVLGVVGIIFMLSIILMVFIICYEYKRISKKLPDLAGYERVEQIELDSEDEEELLNTPLHDSDEENELGIEIDE